MRKPGDRELTPQTKGCVQLLLQRTRNGSHISDCWSKADIISGVGGGVGIDELWSGTQQGVKVALDSVGEREQ